MRYIIILLMFVALNNVGLGQISFHKYYTNNGVDVGNGVVELEDSSYVITGASSSFVEGPSQAFLMRIDSVGNYVWSHHYGGSEIESGRRVLYRKNVGFYICGFTNSIGNGGFDNYLAKTDENGILEWEKSYGGEGWEKVHDAALTRDTGVIMVGETNSTLSGDKDIYIVRTDTNGDTLWTKTLGGVGDDYATTIKAYNDSTFVVGGTWYLEDSLKSKAYITYIKDDGTVFWETVFGNNGNYLLQDFEFNGFLIQTVGETIIDNNHDVDAFICIVQLNNGLAYGDFVHVTPGYRTYRHITKYGDDSHYYISVDVEDEWSRPIGEDVRLSKFDVASLTNLAEYKVSNEQPDVSNDLIRTQDGGIIAVGYSTGVDSGGNEIFVVKIGPNDLFPDENDITIQPFIGLEESELDKYSSVYPNPANDKLNIVIGIQSNINFRMIDVYGKVVREGEFELKTSIEVGDLNNGLYLLDMTEEDNGVSRKKILIQR